MAGLRVVEVRPEINASCHLRLFFCHLQEDAQELASNLSSYCPVTCRRMHRRRTTPRGRPRHERIPPLYARGLRKEASARMRPWNEDEVEEGAPPLHRLHGTAVSAL